MFLFCAPAGLIWFYKSDNCAPKGFIKRVRALPQRNNIAQLVTVLQTITEIGQENVFATRLEDGKHLCKQKGRSRYVHAFYESKRGVLMEGPTEGNGHNVRKRALYGENPIRRTGPKRGHVAVIQVEWLSMSLSLLNVVLRLALLLARSVVVVVGIVAVPGSSCVWAIAAISPVAAITAVVLPSKWPKY